MYKKSFVKKTAPAKTIFAKAKDQVVRAARKRYTDKKGNINVANIAKDIASVARMVNTENKHIDVNAVAQTVNLSTSLVYGIGTVAQGAANNQRTGNSIKIDRIDLILRFSDSAVAPTTDINYRWFCVRYLKTPASSGTVAFGISEFLNADAGGNYSAISFPNTDTNENFSVLAQGRVLLPCVTIANGVGGRVVDVSVPCGFHQDYNGSANSTITDNMVFLVFVADATTTSSTVQIQSRMWYIDN